MSVNGAYSSDLSGTWKADSLSEACGQYARPILPPEENMVFAGWNTKADGTGRMYQPGEPICLFGTVTLYAQWKPVTPVCPVAEPVRTLAESAKTGASLIFDNPVLDLTRSAANIVTNFGKQLFRLW